jgi:hypothetical protein
MNTAVKSNGIKFGIITGVVSILITTLLYAIDIELFISMWVGLISLGLYVVIGILVISNTKKELKGILSFKEAFTTYLISAIIGIYISVIFNIILFNFFDPTLKESLKELTIKASVEMLEKFNSPTSVINETIKKLEETEQFSTLELLKGSIFSIIFSSLLGLILAAFFKSKPLNQE